MVGEPVRRRLAGRADDRCEYCCIAERTLSGTRLQVEHVWPRQHGGSDEESNLAMACPHCNWHKGPNLTAVDPETGKLVRLFSPREQFWSDHFAIVGGSVQGLTDAGRATAALLKMNAEPRVRLRRLSAADD